MSRTPLPKRLSVSEDIRLIREKNNIRKQELLNILHIEDKYTLYELEQKLSAKLYIERREKNRVNMLYSLGLDKNTQMDYNEIVNLHQEKEKEEERLYQERLSLRKRLQKQTDEFNISQYRKKYPENNTITPDHFTSYTPSYTPSFHNPGGATIYTQANAANSMVFNQESGIYEPGDF
jgi:hypothetical protein